MEVLNNIMADIDTKDDDAKSAEKEAGGAQHAAADEHEEVAKENEDNA